MLFVVIITMLLPNQIHDPEKFMAAIQNDPGLIMQILALGLLMIPLIVWTVALMYNAYSISANLRGPKAIWTFIASFLIAEILSKVILYLMI
jgi:hypothetical protein